MKVDKLIDLNNDWGQYTEIQLYVNCHRIENIQVCKISQYFGTCEVVCFSKEHISILIKEVER